MSELLLSPLGPAFVLLAAGVLLSLFARWHWPRALSLLALVGLAGTIALFVYLRSYGRPSLELAWWPLVISPLTLRWSLKGWNGLALLLLLLIGSDAALLTWRSPGWRAGAHHGLNLLLLGCAALSVVSNNLLALSATWVATDILLIMAARGEEPRAGNTPVSLVAGSSLLAFLAIGITSLSLSSAPLTMAHLPIEALFLLMLAAALRMTAFPFHLWLVPNTPMRLRGRQWLVSGIGMVSGGWLAGHLYTMGIAPWLTIPALPILFAVGSLLGALVALLSDASDYLAFLASGRASWIWLIMALAASSGAGLVAAGWALTTAVLGLMALTVGEVSTRYWGWRPPLLLAAGLWGGLPLLTGLPTLALTQPGTVSLWLLMLLGQTATIACVFRLWHARPQSRQAAASSLTLQVGTVRLQVDGTMLRLFVAFGLSAVPALLWGLQPGRLAGSGSAFTLSGFLHLLQPGDVALMVISLTAGIALAGWLDLVVWSRPAAARRGHRLAGLLSLRWVLSWASWALSWVEDGWRVVLTVVEGEGYWGWLTLVTLLVWLVVRV